MSPAAISNGSLGMQSTIGGKRKRESGGSPDSKFISIFHFRFCGAYQIAIWSVSWNMVEWPGVRM